MLHCRYITSVMYADPEGDSFTALLLLLVVTTLLAGSIVATTPADSVNSENVSVSVGGSPDSFIAGFESMGVGLELQSNVPGTTCDISGDCSVYTTIVAGQAGPVGFSYTTNEFGGHSFSLSFSIINFSVDTDNTFNNVSVGAGLSFSYSAGLPYVGGSSVSYDIDLLGLIVDAFKGNGGE